jgi:hypothetical protein
MKGRLRKYKIVIINTERKLRNSDSKISALWAAHTYCVLPRGTPPQVRNCLLDKIDVTSEQ